MTECHSYVIRHKVVSSFYLNLCCPLDTPSTRTLGEIAQLLEMTDISEIVTKISDGEY